MVDLEKYPVRRGFSIAWLLALIRSRSRGLSVAIDFVNAKNPAREKASARSE